MNTDTEANDCDGDVQWLQCDSASDRESRWISVDVVIEIETESENDPAMAMTMSMSMTSTSTSSYSPQEINQHSTWFMALWLHCPRLRGTWLWAMGYGLWLWAMAMAYA